MRKVVSSFVLLAVCLLSVSWAVARPMAVKVSAKKVVVKAGHVKIHGKALTAKILSPVQKARRAISRLIKTDKQLKGLRILWCGTVEGIDEIQAFVGLKDKFPQWFLRYTKNGKLIHKELIYGE